MKMKRFKLFMSVSLISIFACMMSACGNSTAKMGEGYMSSYFDTSKADASKFSGVVYDKDGKEVKLSEIEDIDVTHTYLCEYDGNQKNRHYFHYYLTTDQIGEEDALVINGRSDESDLEFIRKVLGEPTSIYEWYRTNENDEPYGTIYLLYDYGDHLIIFDFYEHTQFSSDNINYEETPCLLSSVLVTKERFLSGKASVFDKEDLERRCKLYGKDIVE